MCSIIHKTEINIAGMPSKRCTFNLLFTNLTFQESNEKKDTEDVKQLIEYQNTGKEAVAATDQSTQLAEEIAEVKHQLHVEKETVGKMQEELDILAQERDIYKTKTEEFEARLEEAKVSMK